LGEIMNAHANVIRNNADLDKAQDQLEQLQQRFSQLSLGENSGWANQSLAYARQVHDMTELGRVVVAGARARDESRGSHYKPEFELTIPEGAYPGDPEYDAYLEKWKANNAQWIKTTIAEYSADGPKISFEEVDTSVLPPEHPRDYR